MRVKIADSRVNIIVLLKGRHRYSDSRVLEPKSWHGVTDDPSVEFGGDDLPYAEVDELVKGVDVLLGESLKAVEGPDEFVLGGLVG